ncbi:MAG: hypothetical protein IKY53_05365, partial [Lachnospiraceae bacterium]|nr:hypothetical protein [Lachnospiraceae bacterium]
LDYSEREVSKIRTGINWETSKIREWLNRDFFREAFTKEEQKKILISEVVTPISTFTDQVTYDRVFLPSVEEVISGYDYKTVRCGNTIKTPDNQKQVFYSQYAAVKRFDESMSMGSALRTRGTINFANGTLTYGESCEGHCIQDGVLVCWKLNMPMGIRPVIQVDVTDIVEV